MISAHDTDLLRSLKPCLFLCGHAFHNHCQICQFSPVAVCAQQTHSSCLSWLQVGNLVEGDIDGKVKQVLDYLHPSRATTNSRRQSLPQAPACHRPAPRPPTTSTPRSPLTRPTSELPHTKSTAFRGLLKTCKYDQIQLKTEKAPCALFLWALDTTVRHEEVSRASLFSALCLTDKTLSQGHTRPLIGAAWSCPFMKVLCLPPY